MAETEEGLWMSAKERDRLKVLHEVRKRHITQRQAAAELGISVRWNCFGRKSRPGFGTTMGQPWRPKNCPNSMGSTSAARRCATGSSRPSYGGRGGHMWNEPMCGERGVRAMANWCNGTPVNTTGWKGEARSCI